MKRGTKHDKDRIEISEEALQKLKDIHTSKEPSKKKKRLATEDNGNTRFWMLEANGQNRKTLLFARVLRR